jgi:hypothetical protein
VQVLDVLLVEDDPGDVLLAREAFVDNFYLALARLPH